MHVQKIENLAINVRNNIKKSAKNISNPVKEGLFAGTAAAAAITAYAFVRKPQMDVRKFTEGELKTLNAVKESAKDYYEYIMEHPEEIDEIMTSRPNNDSFTMHYVSTKNSNGTTNLKITEDKEYGINIVSIGYFNNGGTNIFVESSKKDNSYKISVVRNNASYEMKRTDFDNLKYVPKNSLEFVKGFDYISKNLDAKTDIENLKLYKYHPGLSLSDNYLYLKRYARPYYDEFVVNNPNTKIETASRIVEGKVVRNVNTENSDIKTSLKIVEGKKVDIKKLKASYKYSDGREIFIKAKYNSDKENYSYEIETSTYGKVLYHNKGETKSIHDLGFTPDTCDEVNSVWNKIKEKYKNK